MPIGYDDAIGGLAITPDYCPSCGGPRYDTACGAPNCTGARFECCGTGCDTGLPGSRCDAALAEESGEEHDDRVNRERAAFGLPSLGHEVDGDADE